MKQLPLIATTLTLLTTQAYAQETAPYSLAHFGHFKEMMHMKKTDGVVDLDQATNQPHLYAVGAPAHGTGEITVVDGKLWLDYGADGLGNAKHEAASGEQAVLLVTALVETWTDVVIPQDMNASQMQDFILTQAAANGVATDTAFPFLLDGEYFDFDWHILNGVNPGGGHGLGGLFHKIEEHRDQTTGAIVGFYSAAMQGVFTHPGESWHLHVVFAPEGMAGHVDAISVRAGTVLKLPVE